jgi:glucosamine--fructose-6-phosphate aminotransferase (isomerizing)
MNPLFEDILGQPDSLRGVIGHQLGPGRESLARAAAEVRHARKVLFAGMGSSLFASMPAVALLNAHGRASSSIDASELLYYHRALGSDTLAILVSRSGETVEAVKLLPMLRSRGVHVIGVTNVAGSTLAREANIAVVVNSASDRLIALRTYTGTAAALLTLASEATSQPLGVVERLPEVLKASIETEMAMSEDWLIGARCIYVLGRGASLGSAHEGALLFHETARAPAVPMSCAQFRHGPVEVVSPDLRAFVFASQRETYDLDLALAGDLRALGASVRAVLTPALPDPWAAVIEIVPLQIAAARLAEARGIPPAQFQFAPMVTVDETGFDKPAR